jgi:hypothetical protein
MACTTFHDRAKAHEELSKNALWNLFSELNPQSLTRFALMVCLVSTTFVKVNFSSKLRPSGFQARLGWLNIADENKVTPPGYISRLNLAVSITNFLFCTSRR